MNKGSIKYSNNEDPLFNRSNCGTEDADIVEQNLSRLILITGGEGSSEKNYQENDRITKAIEEQDIVDLIKLY
uniref:Uncharacterized protein n=1 Tax=Romanomermis culicivorax TaxID=13658 RepID=A0A915JNR1_ROMCU